MSGRLTVSAAIIVVVAMCWTGLVAGAATAANSPPLERGGPGTVGPRTPGAALRTTTAAGLVSGGRTALVITVTLNSVPPDRTPSQVAAGVVDASRPWFQQVSHGLFSGYFTLKRGPVAVNTTQEVCSDPWKYEIAAQANAAIRRQEPSLDPTLEGAVIYYFTKVQACSNPASGAQGAAGWGDQPGNRVWLNGFSDLREAVHELGHNLGLNHSGSQTCKDLHGNDVPLSFNCTGLEYGDAFSAMGDNLSDGYSPSQLAQLGWNDGQVATATTSSTTTHLVLTSPEVNTAGGTRAVRLIDRSSAHPDPTTLWLEYRRPAGQTSTGGVFTTTFTDGLLVRREQASLDGAPHGSPFLLFMNPTEYPSIFVTIKHPNMVVGQTWADPLGSMQITLNSADDSSAHLTIQPAVHTMVSVPNIEFIPIADAQRRLTSAGLVTGTTSIVQDSVCADAGNVIRQKPVSGTMVARGSTVNYVSAVAVPGSGCTGPPVGE